MTHILTAFTSTSRQSNFEHQNTRVRLIVCYCLGELKCLSDYRAGLLIHFHIEVQVALAIMIKYLK